MGAWEGRGRAGMGRGNEFHGVYVNTTSRFEDVGSLRTKAEFFEQLESKTNCWSRKVAVDGSGFSSGEGRRTLVLEKTPFSSCLFAG